jgi:ubiquinone/menaquinone biosynthesis C-methylase UbiE
MRDWKTFWNSIDTKQGKDNDWSSMMAQVGKTVQRQPISDEQFKQAYGKIVKALSLTKNDTVLDLCCGNGVITTQIADYVDAIFGVDFSQPLIDVANSRKPANATYFCGSALDDTLAALLGNRKFKKMYMNESLQHFAEDDFAKVLDNFLAVSEDQALFYITGIPEKKNLFAFYDTEERRKDYYERVANGTEAVGTWWERDFLVEVATAKGLQLKPLNQPADYYTSHYRFDAIVGKNTNVDSF